MQTFLNGIPFVAVVFDLDGTLYPRAIYSTVYYDFTRRALEDLLGLPDLEARELLRAAGILRTPSAYQGSVSTLLNSRGVPIREWNAYRDARFDMSELVREDSDLRSTLRHLAGRYTLALMTNNTAGMTRKVLRRLALLDGVFSVVLTSDENVGLKPDSRCFARAAEELAVSPEEMLSVGDRYTVDIEPLLGLGGSGLLVSGPSEIVDFFGARPS